MLSLNWIILASRVWITLAAFLSLAVSSAMSCPHEISTSANYCFTDYTLQFQNMLSSANKLCCGMDAETLRAFCQAYRTAVTCITQLRTACPKERHDKIDTVWGNFEVARVGLRELCSDDSLIENYAMHQSCLTKAGPTSEMCFHTHLRTATEIKFLTEVTTHKNRNEQFCVEMLKTIECVRRNVNHTCGHQPAVLSVILVKPMVRMSTECNYSVIENQLKTTKRPHHGQDAYISDKHSGSSRRKAHKGTEENPGNSSIRHSPSVSFIVSLFLVALIYRGRPS
ncbi:unnamed protein product [Lymnaea stagnalis]|uniref:Secreted protein n=1 Tax=Lymnaea stagnalis TaxID=6523 RepID=A0AAV2I048_LYMST